MNADSKARFWLGAIITAGFFATVFIALFVPTPAALRDILLVLIGALVGSFKDVTAYFFGSSAGSAAKDATIRELVAPPDPEGDLPMTARTAALATMRGPA